MKSKEKKQHSREDKQPTHQIQTLSPSRKRVFTLILILFPIVIFSVTELTLRLFHYGGNLDLVVTTTVLGKEYYTLNRDVALRYFSQKGIGVPEAHDDLFAIQKPATTKRIFMLGESTMAGYPYDYNATAPMLLQDRLKEALPHYTFEVINCGLAATNSYTVLDFAKELAAYSPDAYVVYVGHNEFYGAMGVGSTEYLGQWRGMINTYLKLRNLKIFLMIRDGMLAIRSLFRSETTPQQQTLMGAMVGNKTIQYNSDEYLTAKNNFEANLRDLIAFCKEKKIPLVLSTLASNLRDQQPLQSIFSSTATEQQRQDWQTVFNTGNSMVKVGNISGAIDQFRQAIAIDSLQADGHYALASCYDKINNYSSAEREYTKARDFDGLRFRATTEFTNLVRSLTTEAQTPLADAEKIFRESSPEGITGKNLMLEHLHPNFDGYFLLAKIFAQSLRDHDVIAPKQEWLQGDTLSDEKLKELSGVTQFDFEAANFRIFMLTHSWPFVQDNTPVPQYATQSKISELAVDYAKKRLAWSKARSQLAEWYGSQGKYLEAAREYYAQSKVMWYYYIPVMNMGDMYNAANDSIKAEECYLRSLSISESPFAHVRLGMLYYNKKQIEKSIRHFEAIFSNAVSSLEMNTGDRSVARYFLAAAYWANHNKDKTIQNLQYALQLDPNNREAKAMLNQFR